MSFPFPGSGINFLLEKNLIWGCELCASEQQSWGSACEAVLCHCQCDSLEIC